MEGGKRASRSGNTFRRVGGRFQKNKQPRAVIIRQSFNLGRRHEADAADDAFISADGVEFSLNKKGRWNLPEVIKENIVDDGFEDDFSGVRVSMLHRHLVNRQSDCLRVITNTLQESQCHASEVPRRKKARRKTYCNGLNVLNNGRGKQTKDTRKKQVISTKVEIAARKAAHNAEQAPPEPATKIDEKGSNPPEVRYDVFYPLPAFSSLRYHPKFARTPVRPDNIEQRLRATPGLKSGKGTKKRNKEVRIDDTYFDDDCLLDDFHEDMDDDCWKKNTLLETSDTSSSFFEKHYSSAQEEISLSRVLEEALFVASWQPLARDDMDVTRNFPRPARNKKVLQKKEKKYWYQTEQAAQPDAGVDLLMEDSYSDTSSEDNSFIEVSVLDKLPALRNQSVRVVLPEDAVTTAVLSQQYGSNYTEAGCLPRKFLIDTTDSVREALKRVQKFRDVYLPSVDLSSCVIFSYVCEDNESQNATSTADVVFRVTLNMNYTEQNIKIRRLQEMAMYDNVEQVLEDVLEFICTLQPQKLVHRDLEAPPCALKDKTQPDFHAVSEVNGWRASVLSLSHLTSASCFPDVSQPNTQESTQAIEIRNTENDFSCNCDEASGTSGAEDDLKNAGDALSQSAAPEPGYCGICFDDITPATRPATALRACGHWFCDTCWQSHLLLAARSGMAGGSGRGLQCPEYRCPTEADLGTLLSLLHVRDVQLLTRRRLDLQVTGSRRAKWCPNPLCGRVIQLHKPGPEPTSLACTCGTRLCFTCLGNAHWPASCDEVKTYHNLLVKRGDMQAQAITYPDVMVWGKNCPSCGAFLEKRGGCNQMICVCNFAFCWWCTKAICVCTDRHNDRYRTSRRVVKHVDTTQRDESEWYEMAVQHRRLQDTWEVRRKIKMAEDLVARLRVLVRKCSDSGMPCQVTPSCLNEVAAGIIKLKVELHHVIEHTAVILDLRQNATVKDAAKSALSRAEDKVTSVSFGKVKDVLHRLAFVCSSLELLLKAESARELQLIVPRFQQLQANAKNTLKALATLRSSN